ncbi:hypothetical protein DFH27DRAFT_621097, partial [Peziza echinospora]
MSASNVSPNTLITTKLLYSGSIRRFKVYLKDCGANTLPGKLKELLGIPEEEEVLFERWSDSAASYVVLDSNKPAVYKQLYRAAKAKLKLRIKVSHPLPEGKFDLPHVVLAPLPQPFTASASNETLLPPYASTTTLPIPDQPEVQAIPPAQPAEMVIPFESVSAAVAAYFDGDEGRTVLRATIGEEMEKEIEKRSLISQSVASLAAPSTTAEPSVAPKPKPLTMKQVYAVYCNVCSVDVDSAHFHCGICDGGDFDLCEKCVTEGKHCLNEQHWMVKRSITNGEVVSSREYMRINFSLSSKAAEPAAEENEEEQAQDASRTCNCCCKDFPEAKFIECTVCPDYDLCLSCHVKQNHGHDPSHKFRPALPGTVLTSYAQNILEPGRNFLHFATCNGCYSQIYGARHKCLSCPDWDYCSECFKCAKEIHPGHRFGTFYEALPEVSVKTPAHHYGVYCDGPLCQQHGEIIWISGDRYKCAICPDFDLCASCEASPLNTHNPTHPLIKFKSPVRNVTVQTMDSDTSVELGDQVAASNSSTSVQTVADVQPTEETITEELPSASKPEESPIQKCLDSTSDSDNSQTVEAPAVETFAVADPESYITERGDVLIFGLYLQQDIADGSIFTAGEKFTQTWVVRNDGFVSWPVGTTLTFSGGDNMSGTVVTVTDVKVESGKEFDFSVEFVVPVHTSGRLISYWSLCTADGIRFGPQLWCDIAEVEEAEEEVEEEVEEEAEAEAVTEALAASHVSEMIFPTLDTEAPALNPNTALPTESTAAIPATAAVAPSTLDDVSDTVSEGYSIDDEDDLENFISDEEDYEVLMASDDEEF